MWKRAARRPCFRQGRVAGLLRGRRTATRRPASRLLLSARFRRTCRCQMLVSRVRPDARMTRVFVAVRYRPAHVLFAPAATIAAHRDAWERPVDRSSCVFTDPAATRAAGRNHRVPVAFLGAFSCTRSWRSYGRGLVRRGHVDFAGSATCLSTRRCARLLGSRVEALLSTALTLSSGCGRVRGRPPSRSGGDRAVGSSCLSSCRHVVAAAGSRHCWAGRSARRPAPACGP